MRKHIQLIIAGISLAVATSSCKKDFLTVDLFDRIEAKKYVDYEQLMNSRNFYAYLEDGALQSAVVMGEEMAAEQSYFEANNSAWTQHLFRWEDRVYLSTESAYDLKYFLNNIYVCNKIINEVGDAETGTAQQKSQLTAEAMATRAWIQLQLNNLYAPPYTASSAATDLAMPYVTTADIAIPVYQRNTVQQAYDLMIADLTNAIPLLPLEQTYNTRFTKPAAEALLGKVYVFMGKYADALTHFNNAFTLIGQMSKPPRLYDYNVVLAPGGIFYPEPGLAPDGPGNNPSDFTESLLGKAFYASSNPSTVGVDGLVITPATQALYASSDLRLLYYTPDFNSWGDTNPSGRLRRSGNMFVKFGMELSDLYLLRAECQARLNNLSGAVADVQALRVKRMPAAAAAVPATIAGNQNNLIRFVIDERTREFAAEGYCWLDTRRLYNDPLFSGASHVHYMYNEDGTTSSFPLRKERLTLRFPQKYVDLNPGMTNNP